MLPFHMDCRHGIQQKAQRRLFQGTWNYRMSLHLHQLPRLLTRRPLFKPPKSLLIFVLFTNEASGHWPLHCVVYVSRHQHSPSIALTEEDSTEGKLPIEEYWSPESMTPEGVMATHRRGKRLDDGRG